MKGCLPSIMGANASALVKDIGPDQFPPNEHYFGFVNVLSYRTQQHGKKETLLNCLCDLFHNIATQKKKVGVVQPKKFVAKLRKEYELFDNYLQHDAHEFIIFLLNYIGDVLREEAKAKLEKQRKLELSENKINANGKKERSGLLFNARRRSRTKKENSSSGTKPSFLNNLKLRTSESTPTKNLLNSSSDISVNEKGVSKTLNGYANGTSGISGHSDKSFSTTSLENDCDISNKKSFGTTLLNGECDSETSTTSLHQEDSQSFDPKEMATWVHDIFQGTLTNETRCLTCETISNKDEKFFDLSVDVEQNTSISHCLRGFSNTETLCGEHKYYCENCCSKQEAQKRMRVKKLPMILTLHLKRFKYMDNPYRYTKLSYRVVFPFELRLFNTSDDATNADRLYDLIAVVVHCGSGPNRGHYITIVKSHGLWLLFDDDLVEKIEPTTIEDFYGLAGDIEKNSESGYILFYQSKE